MKTFKCTLMLFLLSFSFTKVFCQWTNGTGSVYTFNKVGIGLSSPTTNLDIFGASNPSLKIGANSNIGVFEIGVASCSGCFSSFALTGDIVFRSSGSASGNLLLTARSGDGILFGTGDGITDFKRMEILNNGKVVIGNVSTNTATDYKLYVATGILTEKVTVALSSSGA